jgi:hypothetical protein
MTTPSIRISNSDDFATPKNNKPNLSLTSVHTFSEGSGDSGPDTPTLKKAKFRSLKFIDKAEKLTKENLQKHDENGRKVSFRNTSSNFSKESRSAPSIFSIEEIPLEKKESASGFKSEDEDSNGISVDQGET